MINLLNELVNYLSDKLTLTPSTNIFYNSMPDSPNTSVLLTLPREHIPVLPQIDASTHYLRVTARAKLETDAYDLAASCYRWLLSDEALIDEDTDTYGFITLDNNLVVRVQLHGTPIWDKTDQQGRVYYYFTATIVTKKLI